MGTAVFSPVQAQTAEELTGRLNQMEEQMRMLVGQVEELTFAVKQLKGQLGKAQQTGAAEAPAKQKLALQPLTAEQGVEDADDGEWVRHEPPELERGPDQFREDRQETHPGGGERDAEQAGGV